MSAASLQQALDLISTYSDYTEPTVASMAKSIKTLNDETYAMKQTVGEAELSTTNAWDNMSVSAKIALQDLADAMDIDVTKMSIKDVDDLVAAYNRLRSVLGETPSSAALTAFFTNIKTSAGEAAAEVSRLEDGSWSIDITNLEAVAAALGTTEEKAKIALSTISQLRDDAGNPITLTINGESVKPEADAAVGYFDEFASAMEKEYQIQVDTSQANKAIANVNDNLNKIPRSVTVSIKTVSTGFSLLTGDNESTGKTNDSGYAGITGSMTSMAGGGRSTGGKTLVGELGRELWISRDGKRQKLVGKNGMEVITMRRGDAIVPNNMTEALIRGGMSQAAGGLWEGTNSSGALSNLNYATGGNYTNWASSAKAVASAAKSAATASESLEDQLKELKEAFDKTLNTFEHSIFLLEENKGSVHEIVAIYKEAQDAVHA